MVTCSFDSGCKLKIFPAQPHWFFLILAFVISVAVACKAHSQTFVDQNHKAVQVAQVKKKSSQPEVGRKAAEKYFKDIEDEADKSPAPRFSTAHFLALHIGGFLSGDAFSWGGSRKVEDAGELNVGVTYRMGEWSRSMDLLFRFDLSTYKLPEGKPVKLSFMPIIQFPEASSRFPLYFGLGLGPGVYTKQISGESDISIDYQLIAGARYFNLFHSTGLFIETGIKNHFHILSSGQFNGVFLASGAVFTF